jgi:toxin ParE1/3/4
MNLPLILRPEAELDLATAQSWYEQQRSGLGEEFIAEVSAAFDRISEMPQMYAMAWEEIRSCRLRRFPYIAYYRLFSDRIEVLAVLHGSRAPVTWQIRT